MSDTAGEHCVAPTTRLHSRRTRLKIGQAEGEFEVVLLLMEQRAKVLDLKSFPKTR